MAGAGVFSPAPAPCSQKVRLHNTAHELREAIAYSRLARTLFYPRNNPLRKTRHTQGVQTVQGWWPLRT